MDLGVAVELCMFELHVVILHRVHEKGVSLGKQVHDKAEPALNINNGVAWLLSFVQLRPNGFKPFTQTTFEKLFRRAENQVNCC